MLRYFKILVFISVVNIIAGESGVCTWYGAPDENIEGAFTASGEPFHAADMTAAHKTLPFGTIVTASCNGKSVTVRINDRGPGEPDRILDLSMGAAEQLGIVATGGLCNCTVVVIGSSSTDPPIPNNPPNPTTPTTPTNPTKPTTPRNPTTPTKPTNPSTTTKPGSGGSKELWNNQCVSNGDCCSNFCDRPPQWQYGVCKNPIG